MSDFTGNSSKHIKLFIPGPTEIRPEILAAQTEWMIGHRMPECADLIGRIHPKLQQTFRTQARVLISASSGTGLWEGAARSCVRHKVLHCINGDFAGRWADVSAMNGKEVERLEIPWEQPILPEQVTARLAAGDFDAVAIVHNETSTGVTNPIKEIAAAIRALPNGDDIMIMVDTVSGVTGAELEFDAWDLDVALTSSQKAFALPPGLAFAAVSDRAIARARTVPNRGYYFDFVTMDKYLQKNQTFATPAISLLFALDKQLDAILAEGMEARWARHHAMREVTLAWAEKRGFALYPADKAYASVTVSNLHNSLNMDISALNAFLRQRGMVLSNGYGTLKGKCFRIGHMGDWQVADIEELLANVDDYLREVGLL
jgi:predicted phosphoserine aminotransferase